MSYRLKKRIMVEFVVPDYVNVRLGYLEEFLREPTSEATVGDIVESCYLSEVPFKSSKGTLGSNPSTWQ